VLKQAVVIATAKGQSTVVANLSQQRRVAMYVLAGAEKRRIIKLLNYVSHRARQASCANITAAYEQMKYDS
jgi:aspartate 1-decarboxylase